jgi:hypothetical protein
MAPAIACSQHWCHFIAGTWPVMILSPSRLGCSTGMERFANKRQQAEARTRRSRSADCLPRHTGRPAQLRLSQPRSALPAFSLLTGFASHRSVHTGRVGTCGKCRTPVLAYVTDILRQQALPAGSRPAGSGPTTHQCQRCCRRCGRASLRAG